ncbi:lysophospholipase L1-like esterase [Arthrobacter pascens]|uniref:SGNH/GDSL hydrolase family protein n=1 Tax=Arthrobacter pascens TaxID=1677 RepID=UPI00278F00AE|nr:SGNH/GDSL hydrolase family protein [Arthrobacter pascens]MDQ0679091.1 lysophospholipase L1-like esterase [Arthrobacter pascens]
MTTFTTPHSLPILETTDKIAATDDGLRQDLNAISTAANSAITAEGVRAEGAAKDHADAAAEAAEAAAKWYRGVLDGDVHLNDLTTPGLYEFLNSTVAAAIGSPISPYGAVEVLDVGNSTIQRVSGTDVEPRVFSRGTESGGASWGEFRRTDHDTKTVLYQVSLPGNSGLKEVAPARHVRAPFKIAAGADGFRLYFRNYNDQTSTNYAGDITFVGVYFGKRAKDAAGVYTNDFAETPTDLGLPARTTLTDGSYRWAIGTKNIQIEAHTEYLISYGYTTPEGQETHVGNGGAYIGVVPGAASYTDASPMTWSATMPLDVYLTLLTPEDTPVYGYLGSSTAAGVGTTHPVWDAFGWRHAYAEGAIPVLLAHSGSAMTSWDDSSDWKWGKARVYGRMDRLYFNVGSNDVYSTATLADLQTRNTDVAKVIRSQVADQIFYVNIAPRAAEAADIKTKRLAYNTWLDTLPNGALATYDVASVVTGANGSLDALYDSGDGVHLNSLGQAKTAEVLIRGSSRAAWAAADSAALAEAKAYADATFIPAWKATTAYTLGQRVIAPNGDIVSAKVAFTSGASYSAANWDASTQDGRIVVLETAKVTIDTTVGTRATAAGVLIFGDTGWRDVKASLPAGVTATNIWIRRLGSQVMVNVQGLSTTTGGIVTIYSAPVGFRPDAPSIRAGVLSTLDTNATRVVSPFAGSIRVLSMPINTAFEGSVTFHTSEAWPTTLPGTAA